MFLSCFFVQQPSFVIMAKTKNHKNFFATWKPIFAKIQCHTQNLTTFVKRRLKYHWYIIPKDNFITWIYYQICKFFLGQNILCILLINISIAGWDNRVLNRIPYKNSELVPNFYDHYDTTRLTSSTSIKSSEV